jgi:anti-sigma B factor antagonist
MNIAIESSTDDTGRAVVSVSGAIDLQTRVKLLEAGHEALTSTPSRLVLDLDNVTFIDSTGIGALVELGHDATDGGGGLVLRDPSRRVMRILEISGLVDAWEVEMTA